MPPREVGPENAPSPAPTVSYLPVLDGVRAVAVLLVLWAHVKTDMPGYPAWLAQVRALVDPGILGVDLFFVLSGFLITRILLVERQRGQPVRWFLLRRALRIFPIYYLLLAVWWIAHGGVELPWCAVYLSNFWFIAHDVWTPMQHTWSLCVEEHFYLLWPLAVAFLRPAVAVRVLWFGVLPFALAYATLGARWLDDTAPGHLERLLHFLQFSSPIRFWSLGLGAALAFAEPALRARPRAFAAFGGGAMLLGALSLPASLLVLLPVHVFGSGPLVPYHWWPPLALASASLLSIGALLCAVPLARSPLLAPLRSAPLRGIGRISYGLYLYHVPVYQLLFYRQPGPGTLLLALATTFAVAIASYLAIERPLLRFGARFRGYRPSGSGSGSGDGPR